jgi:hypothetical protein
MIVGLLSLAVGIGGLLISPDWFGGALCSAPDNLPCRPLTLECLFAGAGGLAAGLPAIPPGWGGFPEPGQTPVPPYDERPDVPDQSRPYAPDAPPGYQPPPPGDPQSALNDPAFEQAKRDWARENADRVYPSQGGQADRGMSVGDIVVQSIRNQGSR